MTKGFLVVILHISNFLVDFFFRTGHNALLPELKTGKLEFGVDSHLLLPLAVTVHPGRDSGTVSDELFHGIKAGFFSLLFL